MSTQMSLAPIHSLRAQEILEALRKDDTIESERRSALATEALANAQLAIYLSGVGAGGTFKPVG